MIKHSVATGLITGLMLSLGLVYPTFLLSVFRDLPGVAGFGAPESGQAFGLIASTVICTLALLLVGTLPALRSHACCWGDGARAGLWSGIVAAFVVYIVIVSPTNAWQATTPLLAYPPSSDLLMPPDNVVSDFIQSVLVYPFVRLLPITVIAGAAFGWLEGGLAGALRRGAVETPLALLDVVGNRRGRRRWFERSDDTARAGLLAGVLCGGLIVFSSLTSQPQDISLQAPGVSSIVREALLNALGQRTAFGGTLNAILSPLVAIAVLGFGALAILFLHNPPTRFGSRWVAAVMAGGIVGVALFMSVMRNLNLFIGLGRYSGFGLIPASAFAQAQTWLQAPVVVAAALFLIPLIAGGTIVTAMLFVGAMQGVFYGLLLPLFVQRPTDHARSIYRRLRDEPDQFLPHLYNIYNQYTEAIDVLPHLAFYMRRRHLDMARVVGAHHLSSTQPQRSDTAVPIVVDTLRAHEGWRWRKEIGALYRIIDHGLQARTLDQVAGIELMPEKQTSSLPPMLSRTGDAITRVLVEVKKVERVDDLSSKTIFLNNALEAIRAAQRLVDAMRDRHMPLHPPPADFDRSAPIEPWRSDPNLRTFMTRLKEIKGPEDFGPTFQLLGKVEWRRNFRETFHQLEQFRTLQEQHVTTSSAYPEEGILRRMLDNWQGLVLGAVKDLQGRAALTSELKTRRATYAPRLTLTIAVRNQGLNVAESVRLIVQASEGYRVLEGGEQQIELLTAGSARDVEVMIEPYTRDRLRLVWQLVYDDAVDEQRRVEFADAIEFVRAEEQRPFVRIFPIPYVTGMPLKTGHLFVGREDVFAYIQEHLFGAYQNNVIVLHGQRRTGKTSVLYRLKDILAETHICVLVDMQGKAARGTLDFLYSLADDIVYALEDRQCVIELPARSEFAESPEFVFRSRFLRSVVDALPANASGKKLHLLLMFDEFEELQKRVEDGKLEPEIFPFLRNLMQHEEYLDFVFAGTHKLEELGAEYWSILFNIAAYKKITFLSPEDARKLISGPVAPHIEYDPLAIERIIDVTGGHPYFLQVICHELVSYHNETQRSYLTANDVEEVLDRIVERGEAHFKFIWAEANPIERAALLALSDILETAEAATADQVQALLDKRAVDLNGSTLPGVLANLEMGDILTRSGPRSNLYRFKIDLIRRWIYATRPAM